MVRIKHGLTSADIAVLSPGSLSDAEKARLMFKGTSILDRYAQRPASQDASSPVRTEIWTDLLEPDGDRTREATDANLPQR